MLLAALYIAFNMVSAVGIVFANKAVFYVHSFPYPILLTWIHIIFTAIGMHAMAMGGVFQPKTVAIRSVIDLAVVYVAYIVLGNVSIKVNPIGFYQITKALIAPTILAVQSWTSKTVPKLTTIASVVILTVGISISTVTDDQVMSNLWGMCIGLAYVLCTAFYNIWAGSKQKSLQAGSSQLLHRFSPYAAVLLAFAVPAMERDAFLAAASAENARSFQFTPAAIATILLSAVLGLCTTLSAFLVIGATSALTYNVVGHLKTVSIIAGGVLFYGEVMPLKKLLGLMVAAVGIGWYSYSSMKPAPGPEAARTPVKAAHRSPRSPRTARAAAARAHNALNGSV